MAAPNDDGGPSRTLCVLIGVDYAGSEHSLRGCQNDAENLRERLVSSGAARPEDVTLMRDPTGQQIVRALVAAADETWNAGDVETLFVSFSGHGTWMYDRDGDEADGRDECLCPADFVERGVLRDDELLRLFERVHPGTRVRFLADCCHSGTCLDLPYAYAGHGRTVRASAASDTVGARAPVVDIACVSGCRDDQTSADAYDAKRMEYSGAMTSALLDATELEPTLGCDAFALLAAVRILLRERRMPQIPQLSASAPASGTHVPFFPMGRERISRAR